MLRSNLTSEEAPQGPPSYAPRRHLHAEDRLLARDRDGGDSAKTAYHALRLAIKKLPLMGRDEEVRWLKVMAHGTAEERRVAESNLVAANLREVDKCVQWFLSKGRPRGSLTESDLHAAGYEALLESIRKYELEKAAPGGARLATYAFKNIRGRIQELNNRTGLKGTLPARVKRDLGKLYRNREKISQELGKLAGWDDVADRLGMTSQDVDQLLADAETFVSEPGWGGTRKRPRPEALPDDEEEISARLIEMGATPDEKRDDFYTLGDLPKGGEDEHTPFDDEHMAASASMNTTSLIQGVLAALDPIEREVIARRFGLNPYRKETVGRVADAMGLSIKQVRTIESKALAKLKDMRAELSA